jgi:hypothetical protein
LSRADVPIPEIGIYTSAGSIHLRVGVDNLGDWMFDNEIDWVNKLQG